MKLSICTDVFGKIPFTEMLDKVKAYGIDAIELTTGGWGGCFFVPSAEELMYLQLRNHQYLLKVP